MQNQMSGNPLFKGEWYADPEITVFGDKVWIFPTVSAPHKDCVRLDAFSSPDLITWKKHKSVIDTSIIAWATFAMWAPAIVENKGRFYLFFSANDIQRPGSSWWNPEIHSIDDVGGIGIAVADRPEGPYKDYLGKPLIGEVYNGAQPIDQFVFKNRDNRQYLIYGGWGRCNIAILKDDYTGLIPFDDGELYKEITPKGYVEGPVMFIRDNNYYFMWSEGNWTADDYRVAYGISDNVLGPFVRIGTILESDSSIATGAGHHSVLNLPGADEWYIAYHRRPIPNMHFAHRVSCIDRIYFNKDGTIRPVQMTFEGVARRTIIFSR
jgi:beta-xylosidase